MPSIPVSTKYGMNAAVEVCPNCGKETGAVVLVGRCNKYKCSCGNIIYGRFNNQTKAVCSQCNGVDIVLIEYDVEAPPMLRGNPCDACVKIERECAEEVRKGGILWRCEDCGSTGAVKADTPVAKAVRNKTGILPPRPCGVTFTKENCPVCGKKDEEEAK